LFAGTDLISKLLKMQQLEDEDELAYSAEETARIRTDSETNEDGRPSWMKTLHNSATTWLQLLPQSLQVNAVLRNYSPWTTELYYYSK
jgi:dynein heavy chain 1